MDDGELEFSNQELFSGSSFGDLPSNCSLSSFLDEILNDTHACTHTHTCNPPGPDNSHTHTCYHVHTQIVPAEDDKTTTDDTAESTDKKAKKCPLGNREAVRKYREKKKARTASLEDEVVKLKALNQQLMKRLQSQAVLEAEVARLKCLLVDIRGRIEGEIGSFPYQKPGNKSGDAYQNIVNTNLPGAYVVNPCNVQCDDQISCLQPGLDVKSMDGTAMTSTDMNVTGLSGDCAFENLQCISSHIPVMEDLPGGGTSNTVPPANPSRGNKRKGGARTKTVT